MPDARRSDAGVIGIAAPVFDGMGTVIGSLTLKVRDTGVDPGHAARAVPQARDPRRCNALWPRTVIDTAALQLTAHAIFTRHTAPESARGNFHIDEDMLRSVGVTDFDQYAVEPGATRFVPDLFVDLELIRKLC